jgi:GH15 family glucan-1,4-alpha-glucosidase
MYKKISDYGIIGNQKSVALIALDGSIDWLCLPYIDSPSVFAALLDDKQGGFFRISPAQEWDSVAHYMHNTNVLMTTFRTRTGIMRVTDFMPVIPDEAGDEYQELYRLCEVVKGEVAAEMVFYPRPDYARAKTSLETMKGKVLVREDGKDVIVLSCTRDIGIGNDTAEEVWNLSEGEDVWFHLGYHQDISESFSAEKADLSLQDTVSYWRQWLKKSETGRTVDLYIYQDMVNRSALTLKLLFFNPVGTIAAAATTSLPEAIGGVRNWDYRHTWIRDTSLTLQALFGLGHLSETEGYLRWIEKLVSQHGADRLQIMYGLRGEEILTEEALSHLDGYKGSRPVRIGNDASNQKQLDIYGEIMDAALKISDYIGKIDSKTWSFLRAICDYVCGHWKEKDNGIWEIRGGLYHFVYSKVMCWVALDRGLTIARRYGFPADLKRWEKCAGEIKEEVLEKGWNEEKQSFVQHYETDVPDSSLLLIPIVGFLPYEDRRVVSTLESIRRELSHEGFLYRYMTDDGLPAGEGTFLLCSFWLIANLIALNELEEAEMLLNRLGKAANHLGLFSEEYDFSWNEALGNFPQAFTHIGYINSVMELCQAREKILVEDKKSSLGTLLAGDLILNKGKPDEKAEQEESAKRLKKSMNILRGAFFDTKRGRVAYERMTGSNAYREYVKLSRNLHSMDLSLLKGRESQIAFWINLYNVMVIHGVIELGVKDSVKEVRNFFTRVKYRIGEMVFSLEDIEHGILRGNKRPPHSLFPRFKWNDRRSAFSISPMDPRIHFALVCASSSCPPIEVYTEEDLDEELSIAGKTFLNGGGVLIDRTAGRVSLSRIFKWYGGDFGQTGTDILRYITPYIYDEEDKRYLEERVDQLKISYQDYDWRLNKY